MRGSNRTIAEARNVIVDGRITKSSRVIVIDANGRQTQMACKENDNGH